jgi:hypothetical protein
LLRQKLKPNSDLIRPSPVASLQKLGYATYASFTLSAFARPNRQKPNFAPESSYAFSQTSLRKSGPFGAAQLRA